MAKQAKAVLEFLKKHEKALGTEMKDFVPFEKGPVWTAVVEQPKITFEQGEWDMVEMDSKVGAGKWRFAVANIPGIGRRALSPGRVDGDQVELEEDDSITVRLHIAGRDHTCSNGKVIEQYEEKFFCFQ